MGFWPVVLNVLKNSDVVLLVIDARIPEISTNSEILTKAKKMQKKIIIIHNKSDLTKPTTHKRSDPLPTSEATHYLSCKTKKGIKELKKHLDELAKKHYRPTLRIGIVGYPNVGKSSLINLLAPKTNAKVSKISGTTKKTQWIRNGKLRIMDSPGVIPSGDKNIKLGLTASKDAHKIKDPEKAALQIIQEITKTQNPEKLFHQYATKKGFLIKGGKIDRNRTATKIVEQWQNGDPKLSQILN